MHKDNILNNLKKEDKLVFTVKEAATWTNLNGSALSNLLKSLMKQGYINSIKKGMYYFKGALINDIFAVASNIIDPSYIATESVFERFGLSNIIPKIVRVIAIKQHKQIKMADGTKIIFIKFKKYRFFGYNKSRWISISSLEKAFIDSLYLGEFPFFTNLVDYHKKLKDFGYALDYEKLVDYTLRMKSKTLVNKVGFFLDFIGEEIYSKKLLKYLYKKHMINIDRSGQSSFNNKKWMIK